MDHQKRTKIQTSHKAILYEESSKHESLLRYRIAATLFQYFFLICVIVCVWFDIRLGIFSFSLALIAVELKNFSEFKPCP